MAYGVFDRPSRELEDRFFPAGIVRMKSGAPVLEPFDGAYITEGTTHAYYKDSGEPLHPRSA